MALNKEETTVLKILVHKELELIKKDEKNFTISNSPFLNKVHLDDLDLPFMKSVEVYKEFLIKLEKKL
ncbi:MAG: hypothetical protein KKA62_03815 [Nanoarchaeota archaeon]|nr:hypothetical protein [Nanoarchaeota archaeon]MBU1644372.1 hypothetical protein [Nanoarchaeota archaeon]MBU1977052.1 hypothetical protein [Nanoarchaeota archaeon]